MPNYDGAGNPFTAGSDFPSNSLASPYVDCDYPHSAILEFGNVVSTSYSGKEKRSAMSSARRVFSLRFEQLTHADADALWNHYLAQSGTLKSFSYKDYNSGETYTVRYQNESFDRSSFIFDAERVGVSLVEII